MVSQLGFGKQRLIEEIIKNTWGVEDPNTLKFGLREVLYILQEMHDEEGKRYLTETMNMRGFNVYRKFVEHMLYRNLANYDSMLLLTSEKGCLTGDSLLMMPRDLLKYSDGVPLKELSGKGPIIVYSFNKETKKLELKQSDGVEFVKNADVFEIELIDGRKLRGTSDHPVLLTDGKYCQIKDLMLFKDEIQLYDMKKGIAKNIKYIGKEDVFDVVNVRDNHNFIANGFVVSNTGKSSSAIMIARCWCQQLGIRFDPKRHLAYSNKDVSNKIDLLSSFEPLVCDESVRFACIEKYMLVHTEVGKVPIHELVGKKHFNVYSYNEITKKIELQDAGECIKTKTDYVYEIETECGKKIKATKEHNFLTSNGWKRLDELREGDELVDI